MAEWFDGFDDETKGYLQSRGWDKKPAEEVAAEAIKAHRNAESKLGIPADRVLKMPDEGGDFSQIWDKLGVPKEAKDYDLTAIKDEKQAELFRAIAGEAKMTKTQAATLATKFAEHSESQRTQLEMQKATDVSLAKLQLEQKWGGNKDSYEFIAKRAGEMIGLTAEQLNVIAQTVSYPVVMEGLLKLGTAMGEQKLLGVTNVPGMGSGIAPMTREQATEKLADLKKDQDFLAKWAGGDKESARLLENLNRLILGMKPV